MSGTGGLLAALAPDFLLILAGAGLRRTLHLGDHFWSGVEKLVYFVLFPALLFNGLVRTRIDWVASAPLLLAAGGAFAGGLLLGQGTRAFDAGQRHFASTYQCAFRFNSYIGLAVIGSLHGPSGVAAMAMVIGCLVPLANIAAVISLARHGEHAVFRELLRNPLILATLAGLGANLGGFEAPEVLLRVLGRLADAAVALGLLAVGAGLKLPKVGAGETARSVPAGLSRRLGANLWLLLVKLVAMPAIARVLAIRLGLSPLLSDVAVVFAALPVASSAYILAQRLAGDGAAVAWLVSVSTLLGMLTLPLWLSL